jgi:hypothetical protein
MMEIYPEASPDKIGIMWDTYCSKGIIQLLLDLDENQVVATSISINYQTYWQLNSEFHKKIPSISKYIAGDSETLSIKEYTGNQVQKEDVELSPSEIQERLDQILDEITEKGFDGLSKDKQKFLQQFGGE